MVRRLRDERGSIRLALDYNDTNVYGVYGYDAYGLRSMRAGQLIGRFGYTGQVWLQELGMYYYKARMYHPVIGRFMQTDPIG